MKKLFSLSLLAVVLFGCSGGEKELPVMTCELNQDDILNVKIETTYDDQEITKQVQTVTFKAIDQATYDSVLPSVESDNQTFNAMEGAKCEVKEDKANLTFTQVITLDLEKMSKEDVKKVIGITGDYTCIDVDRTKENFESQGFTCTK